MSKRRITTYTHPSQISPTLSLQSDLKTIIDNIGGSYKILTFYTGDKSSDAYNESIYNITHNYYTNVIVYFYNAARCHIIIFTDVEDIASPSVFFGHYHKSGNNESILTKFSQFGGDSIWRNATLENGWKRYDSSGYFNTAQYTKIGSRVYLRGMITGGQLDTTAFVLPVLYRPKSVVQLATGQAYGASSYKADSVQIEPNGNVTLGRYNTGTVSWYSLDGISFDLN